MAMNMKPYKHVHLDNLEIIIEQALKLFPENMKMPFFYIDDNKEKFLGIPELRNELDRLELTEHVYGFAFYLVHSYLPIVIHLDGGNIIHSLNIPLKDCKNTFVNFYKTNVPPKETRSLSGNQYYSYNEEDCEVIDRLELISPHIINVKIPHAVINTNPNPRLTLLIRLNPTAKIEL